MSKSDAVEGLVALLGVGAAVQNFVLVGLPWKLLGVCVAAVVVSWRVCVWFCAWCRPMPPPGHGGDSPSNGARVAVAALGLALVCALFCGVASWVIAYNAIHITIVPKNTGTEFHIRAAVEVAAEVDMPLPANMASGCRPVDLSTEGSGRADAILLDWSSPTPKIRITNFVHPQVLGVRCASLLDPTTIPIRVAPPTAEVFLPDRDRTYKAIVLTTGGVIWIAFFLSLWHRLRH